MGGGMTSAAGWIYKGASGAAGSERTQSAPRSSGTRAHTAAPPARSAFAWASICPCCRLRVPLHLKGTMHLSHLLAWALLLTLLSLWQSEAKPGVPSKVGAVAGMSGL